jgi:DNA-binding response OmpR family regulator
MQRVAVVDVDTQLLDLMDELFQEEGWELVACAEVGCAFARVKRAQPAAIVLDVWLDSPETGWQLVQQLKGDPATGAIPMVICTAAVDHLQDRQEWLRNQGISVVVKPFDIDELLRQVEAALTGIAVF